MDLKKQSVSTLKRGDRLQGCGRSVRQLEEAVNRLTNENFNLKLRNLDLEDAQPRPFSEFLRRFDFKIKLEEELRKTRRDLKDVNVDNEGLRKQFFKLYELEMANKRLEESVLEKETILKEAAQIISAYQDGNLKTEMLVEGIRKLLKVYDA